MTEYAGRQFVPGDRLLRRDIRLLGLQFRELVLRHYGSDVWEELHRLRDLAQRRREGEEDAESAIAAVLATLPVPRLALLTRAMEVFFDLANLAEDRHRVRVLRQREATAQQSETILQAVNELRRSAGSAELQSLLAQLEIEPVFTAHPTEAKRRTVRRILRRLRRDLYLIDRSHLLREERSNHLERMRRDLLALWLTDPISPRNPTVMEELHRTIYAVRTLWLVGPQIMQKLRSALKDSRESDALNRPLQFGNWIGGDRDGNPSVTSEITRLTLAQLRSTALALHRRSCRAVLRRLTASSIRCPLPHSLKIEIQNARERWPSLARHLDPLHPHEWIVQWLTVIEQRLLKTAPLPDGNIHPMAYANAGALANDVNRISQALRKAGHDELTEGALLRWEDRIRIFGLHLLRLDIRVNSSDIRTATAQILAASHQQDDYEALAENGRWKALDQTTAKKASTTKAESLTPETTDLLNVLTLTQRLARKGDAGALGQFIVSMTHQPSDILALIWLMHVAARRDGNREAACFPVVPLFETIQDLTSADRMLETLLDNPEFQKHLSQCGNRLTCMVGYSDSAKDGGYVASNWALYDAQRRMAACTKERGVILTIFHGRGGAIGRGGGPAARAITSLPREAVNGRLRLTEQGEVIAERYDDPAIAQRHLEQLFWATLWQSIPHKESKPPDAESVAQDLADFSMKAYRELVESPGFRNYLHQCTALPLIEKLPIGSRPSRRSDTTSLEELRAIPFTFAWNQARMPINAFYGLGAAFEAIGEKGRDRAVELYRQWPWFRAVIDNAELALARCDTAIARRYALRGSDQKKALEIWRRLRDEHDASLRAVFAIKEDRTIMRAIPWLHRTIRIRNPYLDMLNLVQLELMARLDQTSSAEKAQAIDEALRLTVQAIAAGLRNTG